MPKHLFHRLMLAAPIVLALVFVLVPATIDPAAYRPKAPMPLQGPLAPNQTLAATQLIAKGQIQGPEDVAVDAAGRIYGAAEDGRIVRVTLHPNGEESLETFAVTGGRPLGLHFDAGGRLIVADAVRGLLAIDAQGTVETLLTEVDGLPFAFTDDLDIASDGRIYFSDASWRHGHHT